jgi:hypothetical protein
VIPVDALSCDPHDAVLVWRVVAVFADSDNDCCAPCWNSFDIGAFSTVIPRFCACCTRVLSKSASVSPRFSCSTSRTYSSSLYSTGISPSVRWASETDLFRTAATIMRPCRRAADVAIVMSTSERGRFCSLSVSLSGVYSDS